MACDLYIQYIYMYIYIYMIYGIYSGLLYPNGQNGLLPRAPNTMGPPSQFSFALHTGLPTVPYNIIRNRPVFKASFCPYLQSYKVLPPRKNK